MRSSCCRRGGLIAISAKMSVVEKLSPFDQDSGELNVIIETPRGCRNKYSYDEKHGVFKLSGVLPAGAVFPFDFGFIPRTVGDDGRERRYRVTMTRAGSTERRMLLNLTARDSAPRCGVFLSKFTLQITYRALYRVQCRQPNAL